MPHEAASGFDNGVCQNARYHALSFQVSRPRRALLPFLPPPPLRVLRVPRVVIEKSEFDSRLERVNLVRLRHLTVERNPDAPYQRWMLDCGVVAIDELAKERCRLLLESGVSPLVLKSFWWPKAPTGEFNLVV